jgi:hypothetical protein
MRLIAAWAFAVCAFAQITVDETATRARLVNGVTTVSLALKNSAPQAVQTEIELEWLDTKGARCRTASLRHSAPPGVSAAVAALGLKPEYDVAFWRLHYKVQPSDASAPQEGMLSFSHVADHAFQLTAFAAGTPHAGTPFEFRVLATHPLTSRPVAGVTVTLDKTSAKTGANGIAVLRIVPDPDMWDYAQREDIKGTLGDLVLSTDVFCFAMTKGTLAIHVDKPLYQPGQTVHARILAIDATNHARKNASFDLRIEDTHSKSVFSRELTTSRFGIAAFDWEIPENAEPGQYAISAEDTDSDTRAVRSIEIRPYELPSFRVSVTSDRPYYLPGQNAAIDVSAAYLFGKPVPAGTARIVEVNSDKPLHQGAIDASGRFHAVIDLAEHAEEVEHTRFVDLHYTASVTDGTTNRTEQRQFDIRLSRDSLHLYSLGTATSGPLYIAAYTPDGKPAVSDVEATVGGRRLAAVRTNRFGIARLDLDTDSDEITLHARSADAHGTETVTLADDRPHLRIETDHALYRAGELVRCRLYSDRKNLRTLLLAWNEEGQVLYSHSIHVKDGRAEALIPYDPRMGRELAIVAISQAESNHRAGRVVLFPGAPALSITTRPGKPVYRPGEQASVRVDISAAGQPVQAALGVAVVDEAVWERAATDSATGQRRWFDPYYAATENRVAGFSKDDLKSLDPAKIDADYQLVAEALLGLNSIPAADTSYADESHAFDSQTAAIPLRAVRTRLDQYRSKHHEYPKDEGELRPALGDEFAHVLDPWLRPYRLQFGVAGPDRFIKFVSGGPDKILGTEDDVVGLELRQPWFAAVEFAIGNALAPLSTFPADAAEFKEILDSAGIEFDTLRDPWGNPFRVTIRHSGASRIIDLHSAGPDGRPGNHDDILAAHYQGSYFGAVRRDIDRALDAAKPFPTDEAEFRAVLAKAGIDFDALRDPWGHRYYVRVRNEPYFDSNTLVYRWQEPQKAGTVSTRTGQRRAIIEILTPADDGIAYTYDDAVVAGFSGIIATDRPLESSNTTPVPSTTRGDSGAIAGTVTDPTGAIVPGVEVVLSDNWRTLTDVRGEYTFWAVPPGGYKLQFRCRGFRYIEVHDVPVRAGQVTRADGLLQVGSVEESVTVTAEVPLVQTSASMSLAAAAPQSTAMATPRVRDYFPETLLWNPELITDSDGHTSFQFRMADSLTEWRIAVIASTLGGRIAEGSASVKAFQPFFVDLDPPRVLTEGDRISLPLPVRNYLDSEQSVALNIAAPAGLSLDGPATQTLRVGQNASVNAVAQLRATAATAGAPLRVTARARGAADAIEKPIAIHPEGELKSRTVSDILNSTSALRLEIPDGMIAGSLRAEIRLYPSVLSQVAESAYALLQKPHGCGEQTISSTYPNLLLLTLLKEAGKPNPALEARAQRNLAAGYRRLLNYQAPEGGFTYWGTGQPDRWLTEYALEFLGDAGDHLDVDDDIVRRAQAWLDRDHPAGKPEPPLADKVARLRTEVQERNGEAWWKYDGVTRFHSWGLAASLEETARAVITLVEWRRQNPEDAGITSLIDHAALYLLRHMDNDGTWYNTHATIRTLQALIAADASAPAYAARTFEVRINGVSAGRVMESLDIARFLKPGTNLVTIDAPRMVARVTARWYEPWKASRPEGQDLELTVGYSKTEAAINDPIRCDVSVSRSRYAGYGMVIAEVGLPPGAEVDRAGLLQPGVDSAEVEPDRVVFYLWPSQATRFHFTFRPRFGMQARTAPSVLWDYYNPEARTVVPPVTMTVR